MNLTKIEQELEEAENDFLKGKMTAFGLNKYFSFFCNVLLKLF